MVHCLSVLVVARGQEVLRLDCLKEGTAGRSRAFGRACASDALRSLKSSSTSSPPPPPSTMSSGPRLSDKELAAINAAAVTREYNVQPHLGLLSIHVSTLQARTDVRCLDYRTVSAVNGWVYLLVVDTLQHMLTRFQTSSSP